MRSINKSLLIYLIIFISFTSFYLLSFHTSLFSSSSVFFYRGIWLLIIISFVFLLLVLFFNKKFKLNLETLIAAILISISINLSFFVIFPVTFERSVTMFLLNTLKNNTNNSCHGLIKSELQKMLINDYIVNKKAVDKRINEQIIIDFIKEKNQEKNQCYYLTPKAFNFLTFSELINKIYGIE